MSEFNDFARECEIASKGLRRIPKELRRTLASDVKTDVATPLARKIGDAAQGPWGRYLDAGTKARAAADPQIVVGGARRVLSGGGSVRDIVFGTEFGGGKKVRVVKASRRAKAYRRATTRQFVNNKRPFVYPTIAKEGEWVLDRFADIVDKVLGEESDGG